eukprot:TRINITY_DN24582_c0_g2_i1.p1 TRINITY_DN24582_c0_g2~~TRINITY_DN24582_c0_g2_i1.p1  ORF type:complete len:504 (+),score=75.58 TRINITY_DN24582_c0_g2_i1:99-1610(+)
MDHGERCQGQVELLQTDLNIKLHSPGSTKPLIQFVPSWTALIQSGNVSAFAGQDLYIGALTCFLFAVIVSWALGAPLHQLSRGLLPQVSVFFVVGIAFGPHCAEFLSDGHLGLISSPISKLCSCFIAAFAGLEMYMPEVKHHLRAILLQSFCILTATVVLTFSLFFFVAVHVDAVNAPVLDEQQTVAAKLGILGLVAILMAARSAAGAVAIVAEAGCMGTPAAKLCIGITIASEIAVLAIFPLGMQIVHIVMKENKFSPGVIFDVAIQLLAAVLLGAVLNLVFRMVVPAGHYDEKRDAFKLVRGMVLIGILYATVELSGYIGERTHGYLRMEPLIIGVTSTCIIGQDESRRACIIASLHSWTQVVVVMFFTLKGAGMNMPALRTILPAALALAAIRMLGIFVGSTAAGTIMGLSNSTVVSHAEVFCTWLTLIMQGGVSLSLTQEVQEAYSRSWGDDFNTLLSSVVFVNMFIGPVLCRLGFSVLTLEQSLQGGETAFEAKRGNE